MANDSAKKAAIHAAEVKDKYTKIVYGLYVSTWFGMCAFIFGLFDVNVMDGLIDMVFLRSNGMGI
jgi:hypothetical protein